jgi:putative phosphonate metabolism protein
MRFAIFFTPPPEHPLSKAAALWLGRDAFSGEEFAQIGGEGFTDRDIRELTAAPRRYGFHATLHAPFLLSEGTTGGDVDAAFQTACRELQPVPLWRLGVERIGSFFALTPIASSSEPVSALAADLVRRFDRLRAPPSAAEIERRNPEKLSPGQRRNLERWGYPYVFDDFRFHMTLTGPVPEESRAAMQRLLETRFRPLIEQPVTIDALSLFVEATPPGDFLVKRQSPLATVPQPVGAG